MQTIFRRSRALGLPLVAAGLLAAQPLAAHAAVVPGPNGRIIVNGCQQSNDSPPVSSCYLMTAAPDGTDQTKVADTGTGPVYDAQFSPDGSEVLYGTYRSTIYGFEERVSVARADGTGSRNLYSDSGSSPAPYASYLARPLDEAWSPDGQTVAILGTGGGSNRGIWTVPAAGGVSPTLVYSVDSAVQLQAISISPAGRIVFTQDGVPKSIAMDGTDLRTEPGGAQLVYSPDGASIAYDQGTDVVVASADGSNARVVASAGDYPATGIYWSPDGAWVGWRGGRVPVAGGPVETMSALDWGVTRTSTSDFHNVAAPQMAGNTRQVGGTLTVVAGTWSTQPSTVSYQWLRDGAAIPGATSLSYTLAAADLGHQVAVAETASDGTTTKTARSGPIAVIAGDFQQLSAPTVSGQPILGQPLRATAGTWTPTPATVAFQWLRDGVPIAGATGPTYVPVRKDVRHRISVCVTVSAPGYNTVTTDPVSAGVVVRKKPARHA